MSLVDRLRQEQAAKSLRELRLHAEREIRGREKLQREAEERERHAKRKKQAEQFRSESEVGLKVDELVRFLETPTIPVIRRSTISDGGEGPEYIDYVGIGSRGLGSIKFPFRERDTDSVFNTVHWKAKDLGSSKARVSGYDTHHLEKYIAVETCPDGTIIFHAGWLGGTRIGLAAWRTEDKEQLFDKALEKAYRHPGINRYSVWHQPVRPGMG